ncbi:hypothetical protein BU17DRAFT_78616 [Hysterangium stoloniferum]|nr:hypothetical protein BU17DRAFT_78616 [Hysterangium stoloniferum]
MRVSTIALALFALSPLCLAAPVVQRGFFDNIGTKLQNATLGGIAKTIGQSIANPQLTVARITVAKNLGDVSKDLETINSQANANGNTGVTGLVDTARGGITSAQQGVDNIGQSLISGTTPSKTDQKNVAVGIKTARDAINQMAAAITTADSVLSGDISQAQKDATELQQGGQGVLAASGVTLADLGLPDDFAN